MQSSHEMKLVFSSATETFNFDNLANKMINFEGPTLILI